MARRDLVVIGGGPGGYVAAIRAAQLGFDVACVDENEQLGGTCLRVGCIPSKAMLESSELFEQAHGRLAEHGIHLGDVQLDLSAMLQRKDRVVRTLTKGVDGLLAKNRIDRYQGRGRIDGPGRVVVSGQAQEIVLEADRILIATGSKAANVPGVERDGDRIGTSTEALEYAQVPEHLVVIGAGYIGLEMGVVWHRLGARVTVLELLDRILPGMDAEIAGDARKLFEKQGLAFRLRTAVTRAHCQDRTCVVECEGSEALRCDRVLVAAGRVPNTEGLGLDAVGLQTDKDGFIPVDDRFETSVRGIYAIGDVIGPPLLAHKAQDEGIACVEQIIKGYGHLNYNAIPAVVYTHPEIASVGRTEESLREDGVAFRKATFPFRANGRARALGQIDGKVKILADARTDRLLGVHILGPRAGDLIAEAAAAIQYGASSEDLARCCHAHPTLSEAVREAAWGVEGRAIHG